MWCLWNRDSLKKNHLNKQQTTERERQRERERDNFIEINRKYDDTCTNKNYNEGLCGLIQGDLR